MEQQTLGLIRGFFAEYPAFLNFILAYHYDVVVWDAFFVFVYGDKPHDVEILQPPLHRRPGSTDPRWDELLHKRRAMRAMRTFVEEYKTAFIANCVPLSREAA